MQWQALLKSEILISTDRTRGSKESRLGQERVSALDRFQFISQANTCVINYDQFAYQIELERRLIELEMENRLNVLLYICLLENMFLASPFFLFDCMNW